MLVKLPVCKMQVYMIDNTEDKMHKSIFKTLLRICETKKKFKKNNPPEEFSEVMIRRVPQFIQFLKGSRSRASGVARWIILERVRWCGPAHVRLLHFISACLLPPRSRAALSCLARAQTLLLLASPADKRASRESPTCFSDCGWMQNWRARRGPTRVQFNWLYSRWQQGDTNELRNMHENTETRKLVF